MKRAAIVLAALTLAANFVLAQPPYEANVTRGLPFSLPPAPDCNSADNAAANCGFETGSFPPWIANDAATPFFNLQVGTGGISPGFGLFTSAPTEGVFAVLHGFDAAGPDTISIEQDVTLLAGADLLTFDYRGGWDMLNFPGSTLPRVFRVYIEPPGGGAPMQTDVILTAAPGTMNLDTGPLAATVDISAFAGQSVRIVLEWEIPESFTGPGFFQVDNVLANSPVPVELMSFDVD